MLTYAYELHGAPETYIEGDVNRISGQLVSHLESEMDYDQGWELIHNESCICLPDTIDDLVLDEDDEYVYECQGCDNPDYGNNKTYYREYVLYFEDTYGKDVKAVLATQRYTDSGSDWSDIEPNSAKLQLFYEGPNHQDCATRAEEFTVDQSDYSDFGSGGNEVWRPDLQPPQQTAQPDPQLRRKHGAAPVTNIRSTIRPSTATSSAASSRTTKSGLRCTTTTSAP